MKALLLCFMFFFSLPGFAQVPGGGVHFGLHGNVTNVNLGGALKNIYGLGVGGGLHLDLKIPILTFRLSGDYVTLSPDRDKYRSLLESYIGNRADEFEVSGGRVNVYTVSLNAKLPLLPLPIFNIYATGGAGLVNLSSTEANVTFRGTKVFNYPAVKEQTKTALNAGAGVDIALGSVTLFGEARITWIFTEGETSTQVPLGIVGLTF